jgi:uncharacterized delta-60 repeat protein
MSPSSFLGRLFGFRRLTSRTHPARRCAFFEPLEDRRVLAVTLSLAGAGGGTGTFTRDASFDTDGLVQTDLAPSRVDFAWDVAVQSDGKTVAVGQAHGVDNVADFAIVRYTDIGSLDSSFGVGGKVIVNSFDGNATDDNNFSFAKSVAIQTDGKIVVAGYVVTEGSQQSNFVLVRLNPLDGTLDSSFGAGGIVTTDFGGSSDQADDLAIDSYGRIVVVGTRDGSDIAIARYTTSGALDPSFDGDGPVAGNGKVVLNIASSPEEFAGGVVIQPDDQKIIIASQFLDQNFATQVAITRLDGGNGARDVGFGTGGTALPAFPAHESVLSAMVEGVALDGEKIVAAGAALQAQNFFDVFVLRLNSNGTPDSTLGGDGFVVTNLGTNSDDRAFDVVVQPNGKIIIGGSTDGGSGSLDFLTARYNVDGSPDDSFAPGGILREDFGISNTPKIVHGVALTENGVVVAGQVDLSATASDFGLARYIPQSGGGPVTLPSIHEGQSTTLSGTFTKNTPDQATITILWGDATSSAVTVTGTSGAFSASHAYLDNHASDPAYTISATLAEGAVSSPAATATIAVSNVPPVANPVGGPAGGVRNQRLTFTGSFTDASPVDTHTVVVSWGDNTTSAAVVDPVTRTFSATHAYAATGNYIPSFTIADDEGGAAPAVTAPTTNVVVAQLQADPCCPGATVLAIGGTNSDDAIAVGTATGGVEALLNSVSLGVFAPSRSIVVFAGGGNDDVQVAGSVSLSAWLHGGDGNDRLKGGGGPDVLLGQIGDDLLVGGAGRDLLIGGLGADRIVGNSDDDIIIGGTTTHDANTAALCAILAEWTSSRDTVTRIDNLSGSGTGTRHNGSYFLNATTVHDDGARDVMTGSSGFDWFFANLGSESDPTKDKITDLSASEFAPDLSFIES